MRTTFNLRAKYILVAKILNNGKIDKFIISDYNGKRRKVSSNEFIGLASNDKVANCIVIDDTLKGIGMTLRHLPEYDRKTGEAYRAGKEEDIINTVVEYKNSKIYKVTARLMSGKQCTGYEIQNSEGKLAMFNRDDIIKLIQLGYIPDVSYQFYEGKHYIKGKGFNINKLKNINKDESISSDD